MTVVVGANRHRVYIDSFDQRLPMAQQLHLVPLGQFDPGALVAGR